ncbi:MAG: RNA polymerase sigma factor [Bacteroidota bacterium]
MTLKVTESEEHLLVEQCRKKDQKAQKDVFNTYSSKMLGVCNRYLRDLDQAEDVMIGGFVKVFGKIEQYKGDGSFEGWIRRIMVNEALTFLRKNKNMYLEVDIEVADREPDYNTLGNTLEADDLLKLVHDLPTGYRTVFNMYAIEGYTHKEIAKQLGISENTSKSQLSRARVLLQKQLLKSEAAINQKLG